MSKGGKKGGAVMAFGPIMQLQVGELSIELAPIDKQSISAFISPGLQQASVSRYLSIETAPTLEDEQEWYDKTRAENNSLVWGIWVQAGDERKLIGSTALNNIKRAHIHQATSGSLIVDQSYWGKGIASSIHKARTWYAFQHMGLHRIMSAVLQGNGGSRKALGRSGYELVYVERNELFVDGSLHHMDCLECLNPLEPFWSQWWHGERPPKKSVDARQKTRKVLEWAEQNVKLL